MDLLIELSTIAAAGALTSVGLDMLRQRVDRSTWYGTILYSPQYARWITLVSSAALATAAAYGAQALGGPDANPSVSAAWAAVTSQAVHAVRHLSTAPVHGEGQ
jgi:hypothetical protein